MKERPSTGISASLLAILGSLATIGCCLPIGFAAALGAGAASAFFTTLRPWFLGLSVVFICSRVLATAPRQAMRGEGTVAGQPVALGRSTRGDRNGPVPPAARWVYRG